MLTVTVKSNSCVLYYQDTSTNTLQLALVPLKGKNIDQTDTTAQQQCSSLTQVYLISSITSTKTPNLLID